jgi:hypothetical protein
MTIRNTGKFIQFSQNTVIYFCRVLGVIFHFMPCFQLVVYVLTTITLLLTSFVLKMSESAFFIFKIKTSAHIIGFTIQLGPFIMGSLH